MLDCADGMAVDAADTRLAPVADIFSRPLLPNEPRILNEPAERALTERYLMPALAELEAFFLAIRARVDLVLQPQQPIKLGKPYPLGQCLEITLAVQKHLRRVDISSLDEAAAGGQAAFAAFLRAGGAFRKVWGDLRGQYFQNAFLIGTLYVDVSNDTVVPTKPKVEILPFAKSQLTAIDDYHHFQRIAERYWQDQVFPNHVLPELAPYCPLVHVSPTGIVRICEATDYMVAMARAKRFYPSEEVLSAPAMPTALFEHMTSALRGTRLKLARNPEQGRTLALGNCREYRAKRWYESAQRTGKIMSAVQDAYYRLVVANAGGQFTTIAAKNKKMDSVADVSSLAADLPTVAVPNRPPNHHRSKRMPSYTVVSKTQHAGKRWRRYSDYHFAAHDAVIPLVAQELPKAVMALPVGFIAAGEAYVPVAVQALVPGQNLFVAPDGRWLAGYTPAAYRSYPFTLASTEEGRQVLCIDQDRSLVTEDPQGEPFFNDDGTPAQAVQDVLNFLTKVQANREATGRICAVLHKHQLIQPWPIKVQTEEGERNIEGLYRIDETVLNALPSDALIELRNAGALPIAYGQLLSMQHLPKLAT